MSDAVKGLLAQVASLSDAERDEFFGGLDEMYEPDAGDEPTTDDDWEEAWAAEAERRSEDVQAGRANCSPAEDVMRRMRERFG